MPDLQITYRDPNALAASPQNARTHSTKQVQQLARSIERFGFNNPILVDATDRVIAGHGRVAAAKILELERVPTVRLDHLSPEQRRAYIIADNRLAELAGWDEDLLAIELIDLSVLNLDFEITDIGFEIAEIDLMIHRHQQSSAPPEDDLLPEVPSQPVARPGDLWALGPHLLFCGDALDCDSYRILLGAERADMIFTDPPYNVAIANNVSGLGKAVHGEFAMASGEMSSREFTSFLQTSFARLGEVSQDGALHFICMDWRHLEELIAAGNRVYSALKNLCVWVKSNAGMGALYRSQHELVAVWKYGTGKHLNNVSLGRHGRNRTNVWTYPGMSSFQNGRAEALAMHPTVKPLALVADAILDCTMRNSLVLDPFGGSGTTILAAERTGRRARMIELEPRFIDVVLHRYRAMTGTEPINVWTGKSLRDLTDHQE